MNMVYIFFIWFIYGLYVKTRVYIYYNVHKTSSPIVIGNQLSLNMLKWPHFVVFLLIIWNDLF